MTSKELLEILRRDILRDTADFVEGADPRLWGDDTLLRYIDEAYRLFARKTACIRDEMQLQLIAFKQDYILDGHVIAVISARGVGNGDWNDNGNYVINSLLPVGTKLIYPDETDLGRTGHGEMEGRVSTDTGYRYFNAVTQSQSSHQPGRPLAYDTDEKIGPNGSVILRLYPRPDRDYGTTSMMLRVNRLPLVRLTAQNVDAVLEIPEEYQLQILDYAAYLALRIVDHEQGDPERAAEFKSTFDVHVLDAKRDMQQKMFTPIRWRFGQGGFAYVGN